MFKYQLRIVLMLKKVKKLNLQNIQSNSQNIGISVEAGRELTIEFHSTEADLDLGNIPMSKIRFLYNHMQVLILI